MTGILFGTGGGILGAIKGSDSEFEFYPETMMEFDEKLEDELSGKELRLKE